MTTLSEVSSLITEIQHPAANPCGPVCRACHTRHHAKRCPCAYCHTPHDGECPREVDPERLDPPHHGCLICQLGEVLPGARAIWDDGDGLRSPSLEGSVSGGGWSDSVQERLVIASLDRKHVDEHTGKVSEKRTPSAQLLRAEEAIARARVELVNAWADAHRRTHGAPSALRPPTDNLSACRVLCDALQGLDTIEDHDGAVTDRVRNAHGELVDALGIVHACLPAPSTVKRMNPDAGIPGCVSCARIGQYLPVRKGSSYCDWCARWKNDPKNPTRADPLPEILEMHHAGKRITDAAVKRAEATARRKADEAKRKKRKVKR